MRRADELPPPERSDRPEDPFSHDWERVFEPSFVPPRGEHRRSITYVSTPRFPDSQIQALMEAAPFEEPERSVEEGLLLREAIADAVEALSPRQQWIFEARHYRGMSIRQIAAELNLAKSYVDRLLKAAIATLAQDPILNSAVGSAGLDGRNETKGP